MLKKSILSTLLGSAMLASGTAVAVPGDLFVQVDLDNSGCSIMRVTPAGEISQWVTNAQILAHTGETGSDCDDTGLTVDIAGNVYFSEDTSDSVIRVAPDGTLSTVLTEAAVTGLTGNGTADFDNGMTLGPDGSLYVAEEDTDSVLKLTNPTGFGILSIVIDEDQIDDVTGNSGADIEGGIAVDSQENLYIADEEGDHQIVKVTSGGVVSILTDDTAIEAVTGNSSVDLDTGIVLNKALYVLDDSGEDSLLRINTNTGDVTLYKQSDDFEAVTGVPADVEGGIAVDAFGSLYVGDDGSPDQGTDQANIIKIDSTGEVSLFVSDSDIQNLYGGSAGAQLRGGMAIQPGASVPVPALGGIGLGVLAFLLGLFGVRRFRK